MNINESFINMLCQIPWFLNCGNAVPPYLGIKAKNYKEALKSIKSTRWGNIILDNSGDLTSKLSIRSCKGLGREYQEWNSLVEEYKKNYSLILEEKWKPKLTTLDLDVKEVTGDISFNILTLVMADAYREIEPVSDFFAKLLEIYKEGFLPCGWKGKKYDGSFIVY